MNAKECVAIVLAEERGELLGALTHYHSKPAIYFGGNHRIIDFAFTNCVNSGIDTVGVLSQCFDTDLNAYIHCNYGGKPGYDGIHVLASSYKNPYKGSADAIYKNFEFIDRLEPEYVLILGNDHVYRMDYKELIDFHREKDADVTAASISVPAKEASRFVIFNSGADGRVTGFEKHPDRYKSNLVSMGVCVFKWSALKKYILKDRVIRRSRRNIDRDIMPQMLSGGKFYTYRFNGYWRDVGTVDKLWESNMDQLHNPSMLRLVGDESDACNPCAGGAPNFISSKAGINRSIMSGGCSIFGYVEHSILGDSVTVGQGSEVVNSVVMPNVYIGNNVKIRNAVVGTNAVLMDKTVIGSEQGSDFFVDPHVCDRGVSLVAPWIYILEGINIQNNSQICKESLDDFYFSEQEDAFFEYSAAN